MLERRKRRLITILARKSNASYAHIHTVSSYIILSFKEKNKKEKIIL